MRFDSHFKIGYPDALIKLLLERYDIVDRVGHVDLDGVGGDYGESFTHFRLNIF